MDNNLVIALIVLILLSLTGLIYLYTIHWRTQARAQLHVARAESRKRRLSASASQPQPQPQPQAIIIRAPSRHPSPPRQSHPPPPRPGSTASKQGKRGRSRDPVAQNDGQALGNGSGLQPPPPGQQTGSEAPKMSKRQQKKERKQQQRQQQQQSRQGHGNAGSSAGQGGWAANDALASGGRGHNSVQREDPSQRVDDGWGGGLSGQNDVRGTGQQDEQRQSDTEWRNSMEAVAGDSDGRAESPVTDWANRGNDGGQQEAASGGWHADDAMEHRTDDNGANAGDGEATKW
ncbi:hypothetical protein BBP40_001551 [Aspergillus hancockii]|nr:hypothetical protein BBP40_001551 [Aspergillus hancockii]